MSPLVADARDLALEDLLARIDERVAAARGDALACSRRYLHDVPADELVARRADDLTGVILAHLDLAAVRPDGAINLRVFTPTVAEHGWATGHTVVQIVVEDMPFLVDSVMAALSGGGHTVHELLHPVLEVRRDITGGLLEVLPGEPGRGAALPPEHRRESWIVVEISRETEATDVEVLTDTLRRVLRDVSDAVEDYPRMRQRALEAADTILRDSLPVDDQETVDAEELLRWLADDHFTFLGYREYRLDRVDGEDVLRPVTGTGLGILRGDHAMSTGFATLPPASRAKAREKHLLVLTKANARSTVHRAAHLDYVGVKVFSDGEVVGEKRFLGLLASAAYYESVLRIPLLREKVRRVLQASGYAPGSHNAKDLLHVMESYPRDELFQTPVDYLVEVARAVVGTQDRNRLRLFVRPDAYGRFLSCLVYLPRERYNTDVRLTVQDVLLRATGGTAGDYTVQVGESLLARLHVVIRMPPGTSLPDLDLPRVQDEIAAAIRDWEEDFEAALVEAVGEEEAARLAHRFRGALSDGYKEDFSARVAVTDVLKLESLPVEGPGLVVNLYHPPALPPGERRFKIYRTGTPLALTEVLPILTALGVDVDDEWPYDIDRAGEPRAYFYDFGLRPPDARMFATGDAKDRFEEAFLAVWEGRAENDAFNALVLAAGLDVRQCAVLRAYAKYLRQVGSAFSQSYVQETLHLYPEVAGLLVELFATRFAPEVPDRDGALVDVRARLDAAMERVTGLDEDRILRSLLELVEATLRTNHFRRDAEGVPLSYLSLKIDSQRAPGLPAPRPFAEIWVCSPLVEGIHLRFGRIARGGLRWSDRREDFRTEVLGLVKAQAVKNAVIVPTGAKGGFVLKRRPDPAAGRAGWLEAGTAAYLEFIQGLLDVTDNRVEGRDGPRVVPPPQVVRWDGDDPYLVVAADKGTATFSDLANGVSAGYGFWLGDAFASGGSAGYDHKAMGITARGAWESVRRHFRELGRDTQTLGSDGGVVVVGIGDMSGDVFGNGMLLSDALRLVAAFDHRHVFLDPDPDPAASYAERKRLFDLPRSSWADYDHELVSAGGGVWERTAKSVPISPQVQARLGLPESTTSLTPPEVIRAILRAPVDLLFNGGIGTYVKASAETHADAGDKTNDAVRVDATDLRCTVVGEGGNLGLTQRARIEYARRGGRINTDAIDNSAGVDTSDREVNIKILLDAVVAAGDLTGKQRDELLASMTDEVAALVLADNYDQNVALSMALAQAPALLHVHAAYLDSLESRGEVDREVEDLPDDKALRERRAAGEGLSAPELAVLLAYTKNLLADDLVAGTLPDDPALASVLHRYFPTPLVERFGEQIGRHPLRREIIANRVANRVVDDAGVTFLYRLGMETAASTEELARAHLVAAEVYELAPLTAMVNALDLRVPSSVQVAMRLDARTLVERAARWFVLSRPAPLDVSRELAHFAEPVRQVVAAMPSLLDGRALTDATARQSRMQAEGVPPDLARRVAVLPASFAALAVVDIAHRTGADVLAVAQVHLAVAELFDLGRLQQRVIALRRDDRWQTMARAALRDDLYAAHASITNAVVATSDAQAAPLARVEEWAARDPGTVARARRLLGDVLDSEEGDLPRLSVGLRAVRTLLGEREH